MVLQANQLRIGNLVTINNPIYHPDLKDITLVVISITQISNMKGEITNGVGCEHLNKTPNNFYEKYSQFIENIELNHFQSGSDNIQVYKQSILKLKV